MNNTYSAKFLNTDEMIDVEIEEVSVCPRCKKGMKPLHLSSVMIMDNNMLRDNCISGDDLYNDFESSAQMGSFLLCSICYQTFLAEYSIKVKCEDNEFTYNGDHAFSLAPNTFIEESYDNSISSISPQFVKIYNQALAAETNNLDEIAGLGYRKSLEFLIKDFSIYKNPKDADVIKKAPLSQCINKYIDIESIKTLAERSTWIGNDEAHYIRKHEDRDISDMKAFIKATVYFIGMILITDDAASMLPKK